MKVTKAKQKLQQLQSKGEAAAAARRAGPCPGNVAQVPNAAPMHSSLSAPPDAPWDQGPLLVRVSHFLLCLCTCLWAQVLLLHKSACGASSCCTAQPVFVEEDVSLAPIGFHASCYDWSLGPEHHMTCSWVKASRPLVGSILHPLDTPMIPSLTVLNQLLSSAQLPRQQLQLCR